MAARDFKKFFKRRGRFVRQPRNDKKAFQRSRDVKNSKSDKKCFKCGNSNHLIEECPKPPKDKNQRAFVGGSWSDSSEEDDENVKNETCLVAQASSEICLGVDLEPDKWIKDSGCSKHMTGNRKLFSTYKAYNGGNVIFGSNLRVFTILKVDLAELVSRGANGFVNVLLLNFATSSLCGSSTFVELIGEDVVSLFSEVLREGAFLSMKVEEDAPTIFDESRVVAKIGLDTVLEGFDPLALVELTLLIEDNIGLEPTGNKFAMKITFAVALSSQSESYASTWSALKFVVDGDPHSHLFLPNCQLRNLVVLRLIQLLLFVLGQIALLEVEVIELVVGLLERLIGSVDMVDKLQMVENDIAFADSCMKEVGCSIEGRFSEPAAITFSAIVAIDELIM
nr:retrovirus-related Pol polyprotein from transposon TNT 1-94 [Tanacetum cinerariifolium]